MKAHQGESSAAGAVSRRGFFRPVASLLVVSSISAIALEFYSRVNVFSASALQLSSGSKLLRWIGGLRDAKNLPALSGDGGPKDWDGAAVVFHGAGGPDGFTEALMERLNDTRKGGGKKQPNFFYDWSAYSTNLFKAAFNGQAVGRHVGRELFDGLTNGKSDVAVKREVHVIGISVGAFAADMAAKELRALLRRNNVDDVTIQLTLLDPFTQRGVFGVGWGLKNFGKDGPDYAQQFMNTDDPVPSTNDPCPNCCVYDVTSYSERSSAANKDIPGHDWPLVYFGKYAANVGIVGEGERGKRGEVVQVK